MLIPFALVLLILAAIFFAVEAFASPPGTFRPGAFGHLAVTLALVCLVAPRVSNHDALCVLGGGLVSLRACDLPPPSDGNPEACVWAAAQQTVCVDAF